MSNETVRHATKPSKGDSPADNSRFTTAHSAVIPKEQLTAFDRWELASFDAPADGKNRSPSPSAYAPDREAGTLSQHERNEHYALKLAEGYATGIRQAQVDTAQMHSLLQSLHVALNQIDGQIAQSLLDMSLEVARQMVREILRVKPEVILQLVSEAIGRLPHFNQSPHLILHPDDAELVRTQMGELLSHADWKIFTDPKIQRGGCRVETAHSNIDATNEARWQHIVASVGQDHSWLSP